MSELVEAVARELYLASSALSPESEWGRGGYKTHVAYWHSLARAAVKAIGARDAAMPNIDVAALRAAISGPFDGGSDNHGS